MRMGLLRIAVALGVVCGVVSPLPAQPKKAAPAPAPRKPPPPPKRPKGNPAQELDHFAKMSPEDREAALAKLPPVRRAQMEQRLERYQRLSPEQQEKFKARLELMQSLPKERQVAVRQEIQTLRAMPPRERRKALNGDELKDFSPDEQTLV